MVRIFPSRFSLKRLKPRGTALNQVLNRGKAMGNNNQKGLWQSYHQYESQAREQVQPETNSQNALNHGACQGEHRDQTHSKTHHADDLFVQMCINDARRRWRWYTAVVQNTVNKRPKETRWIKLLRGILDETRATLDKLVKDTAEFNSRMGFSESTSLLVSGPHMLDSIYLYTQEAVPSDDDRIGEFQIISWTSLPERILTGLETAGRFYLWSEFTMDEFVFASRAAYQHKRSFKKYQRKARNQREAFYRILKNSRDARLQQYENAFGHRGKRCIHPIQVDLPREEVRYEIRLVGLRPNHHPDDVVAQRVIDNARRRWHWYTSLLKAMQANHPDKVKHLQHLTRMVSETKQEYDSSLAATNEFNARMGIANVPAHDPTVRVLMFWSLLYEEHVNGLDELRGQYSLVLVFADQVTVGRSNHSFQRLSRQAHERRAIFDDLLLRARRTRLRARVG